MAEAGQFAILMAEIGPVLELGEVRALTGAGPWQLVDLDRNALVVELMPEDDRVWISAEAGLPRAGFRPRLYELMLQYNARWRETGGTRVVLDGPEGAVVVACDIPASGLDVSRLSTVIRNFRSVLDGWRRIVDSQSAGGAAGEGDAPPEMTGQGVIRG
jgi:hypothetical protein